MLILGVWRDLSFTKPSDEKDLDRHIGIALQAITAVWYAHQPRRWRALEVVFWIGGDGEAAYSTERQRIWFLMSQVAGWAASQNLTMDQALVLLAGHEAMHAVRHAQGVVLYNSTDPTGSLKDEYWTHEQEVEARIAGATLARVVWPDLTLPNDWSVDESLSDSLAEGWRMAEARPAKLVLAYRHNDHIRPISARFPRLLPKLLFDFRAKLGRLSACASSWRFSLRKTS